MKLIPDVNPLMHNFPKWSDTLKILRHLPQDFESLFKCLDLIQVLTNVPSTSGARAT